MHGIVVHHQVQVQLRRRLLVTLFKELYPLLVPVPQHATADQLYLCQFQGREEHCHTIPRAVVSHGPSPPILQWQGFGANLGQLGVQRQSRKQFGVSREPVRKSMSSHYPNAVSC